MKKLITILLIFILMVCCLAFVACEDDKVSNKPQYITVSFHSTNIECTLPEAQTYKVGDKIELSLPDVNYIPEGYSLAWFVDENTNTPFDVNALPTENLDLYLGYLPNTYSISYTNADDFDFKGEFPTSYVYGKGVNLPNCNLGVGYSENSGNWYYGEGEKDYFTFAVPKDYYGDLTLTFKANPIKYNITYQRIDNAVNPNITVYDVTMGDVALLPAASNDGKTFLYWEYRSSGGDNKRIDKINLSLILEGGMSFSIWAVWQE